jgi:hypothetical protein
LRWQKKSIRERERERKKEEEDLTKIKLKQLHDVHFGIPFILFITFVETWRWFYCSPFLLLLLLLFEESLFDESL